MCCVQAQLRAIQNEYPRSASAIQLLGMAKWGIGDFNFSRFLVGKGEKKTKFGEVHRNKKFSQMRIFRT